MQLSVSTFPCELGAGLRRHDASGAGLPRKVAKRVYMGPTE